MNQSDTHNPENGSSQNCDPVRAALPYVVPYAVFGMLTLVGDQLPQWRAVIYIIKVFAVTSALWCYRKVYTELKVSFCGATLAAVLIGLLVIVVWVGLDPYYPQSGHEWRALVSQGLQRFEHPSKLQGQFNPYQEGAIVPPAIAILFRLIGAVLLVPIVEELLWRSWLIRWLVNNNFRTVPMGTFMGASFLITVALFGISHHEWLAGMICGAAFNGLLYWKKDLFPCIVAHATSNLALGIWVLTQRAWTFW